MRQLRFLAFAVISFVAALLGALLSPSTWLHKSLAVALCGVLSANPALCTNNAIIAQSQEASAINPVKVETTQFSDLLAQRSRDFDDDTPKSPPRPNPNNNTKPPSFPNEVSPNTPVRRPDFDGNVNNIDNTQKNRSNQIIVSEFNGDTFNIKWPSQNPDCSIISTYKKDSNGLYPKSVRFASKGVDTCGFSSFTGNINPQGTKIEISSDISAQNTFLVAELIDNKSVKIYYKENNSIINVGTFQSSLPSINKLAYSSKVKDLESKLKTSVREAQCTFGRRSCAGFATMGAVAGGLGLASIAGGVAVTALPLGAISAISFGLGLGCFAIFGGDPPIPSLPKVGAAASAISGMDDLTSFLSYFTGGLSSESEASYKLGNTGVRQPSQRPWDKSILNDLRHRLGIDFCDKQPTADNVASSQPTTKDRKTGSSYGDPHIVTFDGYRYSFQTVGEFTLVKSTDGSFEVQVRQSPVPGAQLSLNSAVAIKSGNSRIAIYGQSLPDSDTSTPIRVDGRPYPTQGGTLPNGTIIAQQGQGSYIIQTTSGEVVSVRKTSRNNLSYMDVNPSVPDVAGRYLGLLGNSNGNPKDDLQTRSGQVIETQSTYGQIAQTASSIIPGVGRIAGLVSKVENIVFDQLYKEFGNSWRISQADSLFDYKAGHTTDTFTDRGFPSSYRTLAMLSPAQVQAATAACQQANVNPEQLEGCIFDVGFTGDSGFAETASQALEIVNTINQLVPNAIPLPKLPVSIPGLPF